MAGESKKPICPNCGSEAQCFRRRREEWLTLWDDYLLWCPHCNHRETQNLQAGYFFLMLNLPSETACPFCGRPAKEHSPGRLLDEVASTVKRVSEEVRLADPDADICPKCGKGEVICSYLGDLGAVDCYCTWRHECTNPSCDYRQEFPSFHCAGQDTAAEAEAGDQNGPGKTGGCPGPHK